MSTVRQVVDQVYRDWLRAPDDMPVVTRLTGDVTAGAITGVIDTAMLLPEEADLFAVGTIVEVGTEQMILRAVSGSTLTWIRGANGTKVAAHSADDLVYPQPRFGRRSVVDAVCDAVASLYPDLYQIRTIPVTVGAAYTELPSYAYSLQEVSYAEGGSTYVTVGSLLRGYLASSTKVALFTGITPGRTAYVTFRGGFERPASEADDLQLVGVQPHWERIIAVQAAADIVAGTPELDPLTHEFVAEQLARETLPPGGAGQLARRLLELAEIRKRVARKALDAQYAHPVAFMPGSGV